MKINRCFNHLRIIIKNSVLLMKTSEQLECNCRCSEYNTVCRLLVKGWDYFSSWDPRSKTWPWPQQPAHNQKMSLFSAPIAVVGVILQTIKGDTHLLYCRARAAASQKYSSWHVTVLSGVTWAGLHVTRYMIHDTMIRGPAGDKQLDLRTI